MEFHQTPDDWNAALLQLFDLPVHNLYRIASMAIEGVKGVRGSLLEALRACDWVVLPWCMVKVKWEGKGRRINNEIDLFDPVNIV
ncbi:hypothetical protein Tco_1561166 [Tanacetum coccineum]